jgi:hypothetical protein
VEVIGSQDKPAQTRTRNVLCGLFVTQAHYKPDGRLAFSHPRPSPIPTAMADEKLTRVAIINADKCKPKKCKQECKRSCPVVRMGTHRGSKSDGLELDH